VQLPRSNRLSSSFRVQTSSLSIGGRSRLRPQSPKRPVHTGVELKSRNRGRKFRIIGVSPTSPPGVVRHPAGPLKSSMSATCYLRGRGPNFPQSPDGRGRIAIRSVSPNRFARAGERFAVATTARAAAPSNKVFISHLRRIDASMAFCLAWDGGFNSPVLPYRD
jgi:hypothetical protein